MPETILVRVDILELQVWAFAEWVQIMHLGAQLLFQSSLCRHPEPLKEFDDKSTFRAAEVKHCCQIEFKINKRSEA